MRSESSQTMVIRRFGGTSWQPSSRDVGEYNTSEWDRALWSSWLESITDIPHCQTGQVELKNLLSSLLMIGDWRWFRNDFPPHQTDWVEVKNLDHQHQWSESCTDVVHTRGNYADWVYLTSRRRTQELIYVGCMADNDPLLGEIERKRIVS